MSEVAPGRDAPPAAPELPAETWEWLGADSLVVRWGLPAVHLFESVGSTSDIARRLASAGAAPGTLVLAERQLSGRGRAGRRWDSPAGMGIWLSMVVPAPADAAEAGVLPLRVGVAIARSLDAFTGPGCVGLKWPNDLIAGGGKLGGILCEGTWSGGVPGVVIVGVGLNVSQRESDLPAALRASATSVAMAAGGTVPRIAVADAVVAALHAELGDSPLPSDVLAAELEARDVLRGGRVAVSDPGTGEPLLEGIAAGIAADGALLIRSDDGGVRPVRSGTVRSAGSAVIPARGGA